MVRVWVWIRAYGQGVGSTFRLRGSVFRLELGFSVHFANANKKLLTVCQP